MKQSYSTIENNVLKMAFPEHSTPQTKCEITIKFHKTLRIPDDNKKYSLPPSLGNFPLAHVDDYPKIPNRWKKHGGIFMPIHQSEAMWISFHSTWPFAVKIASGKINAVSGESWTPKLKGALKQLFRQTEQQTFGQFIPPYNNQAEEDQDYMVVPSQPWLDGFNVGKGVIRQFVAVPLSSGYTVEEQISGSAEHGGLQIMVYPMKKSEWLKLERPHNINNVFRGMSQNGGLDFYGHTIGDSPKYMSAQSNSSLSAEKDMGLGAGGFMKQEISKDKYGIDVWDSVSERIFVHLLNSLQYEKVTGKRPHDAPLSPQDYARYNYPWFEYYGGDGALKGSKKLAKVDSVKTLDNINGTSMIPDNDYIPKNQHVYVLGKKAVKDGNW